TSICMNLTEDARAQLRGIVEDGILETYARDARDPSLKTKSARRRQRTRLAALKKAWDELSSEVQQAILGRLFSIWNSETSENSDLGQIVIELLEAEARPSHREEELPGFKKATALLWQAHYADWGGPKHNDKEARKAIGAELAALYNIDRKS